jgi:RimJ/RimL family protein N-acetyltransferase
MMAQDHNDRLGDPRMGDRAQAPSAAGRQLLAGLFGTPGRAARCGQPIETAPAAEAVAETKRLILRRHAPIDHPVYFNMYADPGMARFAGRAPAGPDEAWTRLLRQAGHWSLFGYGFLAIEEKATGCFVGEAGLAHFRRGLGTEFDSAPEAGWAIAPWAQGHGYASEAAAAALQWIEARFGMRRTVCLIHSGNASSLRVAEKLGYTPMSTCTFRGYEAIQFERARPQERTGRAADEGA